MMTTPAPADLAAAVKAAEAECAAASEKLNAASAAYDAAKDEHFRARDKLTAARLAADSILPKAKIVNRYGATEVAIIRRTASTVYTRPIGATQGQRAWRKKDGRDVWDEHPKNRGFSWERPHLVIDEERANG